MAKTPKKIGRPSGFSAALGERICTRLVDGDSLRAICGDDDMPSVSMVFRWLADPELVAFREQYERAREVQGDTYADLAVYEAMTAKDASLGRLRMDALKWKAGKLKPKVYGDKITQEHTGAVTMVMADKDAAI